MINYEKYWRKPNETQSAIIPIIRRHMRRLPRIITQTASTFTPTGEMLSRAEINALHAEIDEWHEENYYDSEDLTAWAQFYRRRRQISSNKAFELVILAELIRVFSKMQDEIAPLYIDLFRHKYFSLTRQQFSDNIKNVYNWDKTILPTGITMLEMLLAQAAFRANRIAQVVSGLVTADEFEGGNEPLVLDEIHRMENALLKESTGGGYHGILDIIMAFVVAYAAMTAADDIGATTYTYHAVIDKNTTETCRNLNGQTINVKDIKLGINFPPAIVEIPHPCRSWVTFNV